MPSNPFNIKPEQFFELLTEEDVVTAIIYFNDNPAITTNKYYRKQSGLPYSFINTTNGIFVTSNKTLGTGSSGKVKLAKYVAKKVNIDDNPIGYQVINNGSSQIGQFATAKILLANVVDPAYNCSKWQEEIAVLKQLNRLLSTTHRHWQRNLLNPLQNGWKNKYEKDLAYKEHVYNFKFYIFSIYYPGITLAKYFKYYRSSIEETLIILKKGLEQLAVFHNQDLCHGDASFSNFIVDRTDDKEIIVNLIDCGLSGKLTYGIRKFPVNNYTFTKKNYPAPECDYEIAFNKILPELVGSPPTQNLNLLLEQIITKLAAANPPQLALTSKILLHKIISIISKWCQEGSGFNTDTSDLYSFGWNIFYYANGAYTSSLSELQSFTYILNPFERPSVQFLITQFNEKLTAEISRKSLASCLKLTSTAASIEPIATDPSHSYITTITAPENIAPKTTSPAKQDFKSSTDPDDKKNSTTDSTSNPIPIGLASSFSPSNYKSPPNSGFSSDTLDVTTSVPTLRSAYPCDL